MTIHNLYTLDMSEPTRVTLPGTHSGTDTTIQNVNASGYIYVGAEDVSSTNYGYRILPNHAISFEVPSRDALYAISSAPDMKAAVITLGLEGVE